MSAHDSVRAIPPVDVPETPWLDHADTTTHTSTEESALRTAALFLLTPRCSDQDDSSTQRGMARRDTRVPVTASQTVRIGPRQFQPTTTCRARSTRRADRTPTTNAGRYGVVQSGPSEAR